MALFYIWNLNWPLGIEAEQCLRPSPTDQEGTACWPSCHHRPFCWTQAPLHCLSWWDLRWEMTASSGREVAFKRQRGGRKERGLFKRGLSARVKLGFYQPAATGSFRWEQWRSVSTEPCQRSLRGGPQHARLDTSQTWCEQGFTSRTMGDSL